MKASNFVGQYFRTKDLMNDTVYSALAKSIEKITQASNANQGLTLREAEFFQTQAVKFSEVFSDDMGFAVSAEKIYTWGDVKIMADCVIGIGKLNAIFTAKQSPEDIKSSAPPPVEINPEAEKAKLAKLVAKNAAAEKASQ